MSVRTTVPLTFVTSNVTAPPAASLVESIGHALARVVVGPPVSRSLHNQDALLENQRLAPRHADEPSRAAEIQVAYREIEPVESRHLELIYLVEGADLFTEGRAWAVHYPPRAMVLVSRNTRLALGTVTPALRARIEERIAARQGQKAR